MRLGDRWRNAVEKIVGSTGRPERNPTLKARKNSLNCHPRKIAMANSWQALPAETCTYPEIRMLVPRANGRAFASILHRDISQGRLTSSTVVSSLSLRYFHANYSRLTRAEVVKEARRSVAGECCLSRTEQNYDSSRFITIHRACTDSFMLLRAPTIRDIRLRETAWIAGWVGARDRGSSS